MKALSIKQPWVYAILHEGEDIAVSRRDISITSYLDRATQATSLTI
jgi:hypothetical protein